MKRAQRAQAILTTAAAMLAQVGGAAVGVAASGPALPLRFAHEDHQSVNCIECHHNFADRTGAGLCIDCHRQDPEISGQIETMFHDLCRGCHIERQRELATERQGRAESGPTRRCQACHQPDDRP
ncbi:MAG: cytochrome c3 family protein [Pseudomonadales bacterium]